MKKILSLILSVSLGIGAVMLTACKNNAETSGEDSNKLMVAVSIVPEATFAQAVCGDLAEIVTLVPPGSSPETYEPTPEAMTKFSEADIYFSIGVPVEESFILPNVGDVPVVALAEKAAEVYPDRTFAEGERDPHNWLSPKRVKVMVQVIADEMVKLDAANKDTYTKNAESYIAELDKLDAGIKTALEGVTNRKIVVYHPAFGYLADDYDLEMFALEEEGKEATPQHLQEMIDLAKEQDIKVIFYQAEIDSSQSEAYAEEIGGKSMQLEPLAADYIENLKKMAQTMAEAMK